MIWTQLPDYPKVAGIQVKGRMILTGLKPTAQARERRLTLAESPRRRGTDLTLVVGPSIICRTACSSYRICGTRNRHITTDRSGVNEITEGVLRPQLVPAAVVLRLT
jgi:hypothetical protein